MVKHGTKCSWCQYGTGAQADLYMGPGKFRDEDVENGNGGIPICGGCGGLAEQFKNDPEFEKICDEILELRFTYTPIHECIPPLPECLKISTIETLEKKVKTLWEKYGHGQPCFAKKIIEGEYTAGKEALREIIRNQIGFLKSLPLKKEEGKTEESRQIIILALEGKMDEAVQRSKEYLEKHLANSIVHHDHGVLLLRFKRDFEGSIPFFRKATQLLPQKAHHFYQCALALMIDSDATGLNAKHIKYTGKQEALGMFENCIKCMDYDMLHPEYKKRIRYMMQEITEAMEKNASNN